MYDFPECKYTYFSLIDKSLGHLFHLPASIRTKTRLECPPLEDPDTILTIPSHEDPTTKFRHDFQPRRPRHEAPRLNLTPKTNAPKPNAPQKHQTEITPYNVSNRALAAILSPSLSVYFTSIGRYFFSSFTLPEDLAMRTRFLIAVRSSGLIFNTLL